MVLYFFFFFGIFFIGLFGGALINVVLKKFPEKFALDLEEGKKHDPHLKRKLYQDITKEDYALSCVGDNAPVFLIVILFTSILEAVLIVICKPYVEPLFYFILVVFAFCMVLRLPLLIEIFVRKNRWVREKNPWEGSDTLEFDSVYRAYRFRIKPFMYGLAIIPFLITLIV